MIYTASVRSPYVDGPHDKGIRTFDFEATDNTHALWMCEQHIVSGRESIISIEESKNDWYTEDTDQGEV